MGLSTPILFLVFNRPDLTELVFQQIRRAQPARLYIAADGPRAHVPSDVDRSAAVRQVVERIDWPCETFRNYAESNMGTKRRVASAITWFFEQEPEGIILEDDCLPHEDFFRFCGELLERYREDERVMIVSGNRLTPPEPERKAGYSFSKYTLIWGWASWRRAWKHYDVELGSWPEFLADGSFESRCFDRAEASQWRGRAEDILSGKMDTWDHQWMLTCWMQSGLTVIPAQNLIRNVGFRADATHTKDDPFGQFSGAAVDHGLEFPLRHPLHVTANRTLDAELWRIFKAPSIGQRVCLKLRRIAGHVADRLRKLKPAAGKAPLPDAV